MYIYWSMNIIINEYNPRKMMKNTETEQGKKWWRPNMLETIYKAQRGFNKIIFISLVTWLQAL